MCKLNGVGSQGVVQANVDSDLTCGGGLTIGKMVPCSHGRGGVNTDSGSSHPYSPHIEDTILSFSLFVSDAP